MKGAPIYEPTARCPILASASIGRTLPPLSSDTGFPLSTDDKPIEQHGRPHGALRRFLKLIVEIDSSRSMLSRVKAGLILIAILALFGIVGYGAPALLSKYF